MIVFIRNKILQEKKYTIIIIYSEIFFSPSGLEAMNSTLKDITAREDNSGIHLVNTILLS